MNLRRAVACGICIGVACGPRLFDENTRESDDAGARREWEAARLGPIAPNYLSQKRAFLERALRESTRRSAVQVQAVQWKNIGPFEATRFPGTATIDSGRLRVIVTHPTDARIIYVGTAGGGVWKTTDADLTPGSVWTWTPLTDGIAAASASGNIAVGSLAMSPADPETLYLGLGDPFQPVGAQGFFITHDGGATWTAGGDLGATTFIHTILAIGPSAVLVGGSNGLWRSTDGGHSFSRVVFPGSGGGIWSLARYDDGTLLCARTGSNGIERSTDGGLTWTLAPVPQDSVLNRITLAVSGSTAWALAADGSGRLLSGLFKSTDHGMNWVWMPSGTTVFPEVQGWYNQMLAVDPDDASHIFAGGLYPLRSRDGGVSWEAVGDNSNSLMHSDLHAAAWSRAGTKALFIGHDGGLSVLRDPWAGVGPGLVDNSHNRGLVTHLVYQVSGTTAPSPADARDRVAIGLQDNGCLERTGTPLGQSGKFVEVAGGDGFSALYHPLDGRLLLCGINGIIALFTDGALNGRGFRGVQFRAPLFPDPSDPGGNSVFTLSDDSVIKTTDFGQSWTTLPRNGIPPGVLITSFAPSPLPGGPLLVMTDASGYRSMDGGQHWTAFPNPGANGLAFGGRTLYAWSTLANFQQRKVWRSPDDGDTWTPIDGNGLPPLPVWQIVPDPKDSAVLWAATDVGVYRSGDGGGSWSRFGASLPWVAVRGLYVAADGSVVRAGTYGRGVWEAVLPAAGFTLQVSPPAQSSAPGGTVAYAIAAESTGTVAPIVLGVTGLPAGATASFSSTSPPSVLTIDVAAGVASGTMTFAVTGTAGEARASATAQLIVAAKPGLALACVPPSVQLAAGDRVQATVRASFAGAGERIALQTGALPAGITATLEPSELPGPGDAVLTLRAAPDAAASQSVVLVSGSTGSASASAVLSLVVAAAGAPSVAILSPRDGDAAPGPLQVTAEAQVAQGLTLRDLTFLGDGIALATSSSSPFAFTWDAPAGMHELTARAIDSAGRAATSLPVHVTRTPDTAAAPVHGGCHSADLPDVMALLAAAAVLRVRKRRACR